MFEILFWEVEEAYGIKLIKHLRHYTVYNYNRSYTVITITLR